MRHIRPKFAPLALALTTASLLLAGCGGGSTIAEPKPLVDLPGPSYRMQVLWHSNSGVGSGENGLAPAVANGVIYTSNEDGEVTAFSLDRGKRLWHVHLDDALSSGPGVAGDTLLVGTQNGEVVALSASDGSKLWQQDVSSEVIAAPAAADGIAVARTVDGQVTAMDLASGEPLWSIEDTVPNLTMRGTSAPVIQNRTVYIGMDSGKVLALALTTGEQQWAQTIALPEGRSELDRIVDVDSTPLVTGGSVYAASTGGAVVSLSRNVGQTHWKQSVASENDLAIDAGHLYASDLDSVVWSLERNAGTTDWQNDTLEYRKLSAPAVLDNNVLVGDYQGYLHWLSADDGHEIARGHAFDEPIRVQPVVIDGDRAVVLGADGELALVRFVPNGS